jgi:predicted amidohydrolase
MAHRQLVAAIQMNSQDNVTDNLGLAAQLIQAAVYAGAEFILLPEYFCFMGKTDIERVALGEPFGDGPIQQFMAALAKQHGVWISAGTIPLISAEPHKVYNSNLLFNDAGDCVGRYDKIHLFGFDNGIESYAEADTLAAGSSLQTFATQIGPVRPSVCYDLRFPEMYRKEPAYEIITMPAAFTYTTGECHWETLLKARAIENQSYVIAAAQTGVHPNGKRTFGHSMIIDPWGKVLAQQESGNGFALAGLDFDYLKTVRSDLPALKNRVLF